MNGLNSYIINYQGVKTKDRVGKSVFFKILAVLIAILVLIIILISVFSLISSGENSSNFINHEIKNGESLWSIASQYYNKSDVDLRKVIYKIKKINNIDSAVINPGRELIIPLNY
ncbi:cell division suppressor protein YneA [Halanaerobium congolense]|jgi:cell division protein YceG involved in septum cleavage|uniref:LysM domain-containing protein n=1 Tax=Halanaerobium congolense TaxID=54121 RepID=A0A1G6P8V0_9FIRM|nr:LysM peptidoglycan-binding domain-containing protein [Halanaerobium congolense]KXS49716.1 MAG: peptidoglycan-binding lysin domain-containing protein [Halanaerobium sp. T82-1]OEG63629.1 MAG: peptidoglycan-binding protein LysM [Halanaerobium sp. MDAL1]PTX17187.1 LysM domain-containing protein [Halanaerobium congolense]PXV69402.1 LysM domain-containing protein [Halanaerobium congolense]TDP14938.1 LysM domain-containing protein [Halanaerobium congolense]